jgi:hypothetical protein
LLEANISFVAFILYRQHYQAQVVAQHPGLANPEISKIIGEQWREQAPEVKSDWKQLAEVCIERRASIFGEEPVSDFQQPCRKKSRDIHVNTQVIVTNHDELESLTAYVY